MSERITFRGRGRGCVTEASGAASITEPRVKYIKGWLTGGTDPADGSVECGDGTAYPMEVTVDQLCEIFYRVRDAWFTAGALPGEGEPATIAGIPPAEYASVIDDGYISSTIRGYCVMDGDTFNEGDFFKGTVGSAEGDLDSANFGTSYNLTLYGDFYDLSPDEKGMWQHYIAGGTPEGIWQACAFNHWLLTDASGAPAGSEYGCFSSVVEFGATVEILVKLSSFVAWFGGDSPFDPAASLYLGMLATFNIVYGEDFASDNTYGTTLADFKLTFKLSGASNVAECKLYSAGSAPSGGSDFVLEAQEWWPYVDKAGLPAWDELTGLPTNGGPAN